MSARAISLYYLLSLLRLFVANPLLDPAHQIAYRPNQGRQDRRRQQRYSRDVTEQGGKWQRGEEAGSPACEFVADSCRQQPNSHHQADDSRGSELRNHTQPDWAQGKFSNFDDEV